jgi:hypothetical protein
MEGALTFVGAGAGAIVAVWEDETGPVVPPEFAAHTLTRSFAPRSAAVESAYVEPAAPVMSTQPAPQRCHW